MKVIALGVAAIIALIFIFPSSPVNVNQYIPQLGSTGISFQACNKHTDGSENCSGSVNIPLQDTIGSQITSVSLKGAQGSFNYQGTPKSWAFACIGSISFGNGQSSSISASASGSGTPPQSWPVSITPKQWNLSTVYGGSYGQKNLTAQLGSKAAPCSLTVSFNEIPNPMKVNYRYASLAKWSVNYQPASVTSTTTSSSLSTASQTSTTQTSTTTSTSSTTTGGNTVTTSQTDIWTTTVTSATGGQFGNLAANGIIVDCQPYAVQGGYTLCFVYIPAGYPLQSCSSPCGEVAVLSSGTSVTAFGLALGVGSWTQIPPIPVGTSAGNLVIAQVDQGTTTIYKQAIYISPITQNIQVTGAIQYPAAPYTSQYIQSICGGGGNAQLGSGACNALGYPITTTTTITTTTGTYTTYLTTTVGTNQATTSFTTSSLLSSGQTLGCTSPGSAKCLSIVSITW